MACKATNNTCECFTEGQRDDEFYETRERYCIRRELANGQEFLIELPFTDQPRHKEDVIRAVDAIVPGLIQDVHCDECGESIRVRRVTLVHPWAGTLVVAGPLRPGGKVEYLGFAPASGDEALSSVH